VDLIKKYTHRTWSKFSVIGVIIILLLAPIMGVSISETPKLEEDAFFSVEIDKEASDQEVVEGENLDIVAEIENIGGDHDTQDIELNHEGDLLDSVSGQPVQPGGQTNVTLTWETEVGDAGTYNLTVNSDDDEDYIEVTLFGRDYFTVQIDQTESDQKIVEGEDLNISAEIENLGNSRGEQNITLYHIDPVTTLDSGNRSLDVGESENINLTWETELNDAGNYTLVVSSEDHEDRIEVTVLRQAFFEITINSPEADDDLFENKEIMINYTVTNVGEVEDTQNITFYIGDELIEPKKEVTLGAGETYSDEFNWTLEERGEYTLRITSESENHQEAILSLDVNPPEEEMYFGIWWPHLIVIITAIVVITGGGLYLKHLRKKRPDIEEVFLISKKNSVLILHNTRRIKPSRDSEKISSMFEAVQDYIEESFKDDEDWEENKLEYGDNKIVIEQGEHIYMAVVYKGQFNEKKIRKIRDVIEGIEDEYGEKLKEWHGESKELRGVKDMTEDLFS